MPRPEIDILAYQASDNRILWVECKSYLDSRGVKAEHIIFQDDSGKGRYKVFTWPKYRKVVTGELIIQVVNEKLTRPEPIINYCLITGKIATDNNRELLHQYFSKNGWLLYDEYWVKNKIESLAKKGYENDVAIIVAKLFSRMSD